ncbi:NAD(P)/FAD-dependent oxidoreductase [Saccharothrix texasensis]|uniref:Flavin-dependent dehydrogenase n=1 Tax=Saccharothrix texasensis TaxID=103734 RepID=A0A3N1H224_9PSEU|nr:FAD-dependent oxidoreductase [Saccharothrix texasensis]ROP36560.1 flavin-dependent dehydrogenase [Saccharothrix texasensis]
MDVVIAGAGPAGLASALALSGAGHPVLVLDRDPAPPPGPPAAAGTAWDRPLSPQTRQAHTLTSAAVATMRAHAPALLRALLDAGASLLDLTRAAPGIEDPELVALACRRSTFDVVLHRYAAERVDLRYGTTVSGLLTYGGRVAGVRLESGAVVPADVVVDATGRRALGRRWLRELGYELPVDATEPTATSAFVRYYRRSGPPGPLNRGNAAGVLADHYAGVLHPGDNGTFSVAFGVLPGDEVARGLLAPEAIDALARATPWIREWMHDAEPLTGVRAMTCPPNAFHALARRGSPLAGLVPVGDAACVTDPILGRGVSLALAHGFRLPEAVHSTTAQVALAEELHGGWFRQACLESADRVARWEAAGAPVDRAPTPVRLAGAVAGRDVGVWHTLTRVLMGLTPPEALTEPRFGQRLRDLLSEGPPASTPGLPSRDELVALVAP